MSHDIRIQEPAQSTQLVLLFHGVGASPDDLAPLGSIIAKELPQATIISVAAPYLSDFGRGYQWFSVSGVTEENRSARIAQAMPEFVKTVQDWQQKTGCDAEHTILLGFSQGAIMSLESTQQEPVLAKDIFALSGRFATAPRIAPKETTIHFIHGTADPIMPYQHTITAAKVLQEKQALVTVDIIDHLGHGINEDVVNAVFKYL